MSDAMTRSGGAYRAGLGVAGLAALLLVWTTIVRDDGSGQGFFLIPMAGAVGGWATRFAAEGMARTMLGVAAMQATFGLAVATAPVTADAPGGVAQVVVYNAVFTALWLGSAILFRRSNLSYRRERDPASAID